MNVPGGRGLWRTEKLSELITMTDVKIRKKKKKPKQDNSNEEASKRGGGFVCPVAGSLIEAQVKNGRRENV